MSNKKNLTSLVDPADLELQNGEKGKWASRKTLHRRFELYNITRHCGTLCPLLHFILVMLEVCSPVRCSKDALDKFRC